MLQSATGSYREIVTMLKSGIYSITSPSGKCYIGSSVDIRCRWRGHICDLRARRHHSSVLQATWDKYGAEALRFQVVELCEPEQLLLREQFYIDSVPKSQRYNVCTTAGNRLGMLHTPEAKLKMSESRKGVKFPEWRRLAQAERIRAWAQTDANRERMRVQSTGRSVSEETRAKIGAANKGKTRSAELRARISNALKGKPRPRTAEHSAKIGLAKRGKPLSAEHRAKLSKALEGRQVSEEQRKRAALTNFESRNKSGYMGVSWHKAANKWAAKARVDGKQKHLGLFSSPEIANAYRLYWLATQGVFDGG